MRAPLDDPLLAGFVAGLEGLNALADPARGYRFNLEGRDLPQNPQRLPRMTMCLALAACSAVRLEISRV